MSRYLPSLKGWLAVVFALFAGLFLPATFPARGPAGRFGHVPLETWLIGAVTMLVCLAVCVFASVRGSTPDRVAALVAVLLDVWLIIAFINAAA